MYNILKKGIDPYSAAAHRAEVDLVGSRLSDKDLAAVKMAVQNESVKEAVDVDCRLMGFKAAVRRAEGEKQKGRVIVDRRTKGAKEARLRAEKARAKREAIAAAKKKKEFTEKYPQLDYGYLDDAEVKEIENAANRKLYGETAANSVSSGNVDMAINMGKKKKKDKVIKRADY
jgi:regulator of protease activity HflC (stomatin/prohibitin superfamily)